MIDRYDTTRLAVVSRESETNIRVFSVWKMSPSNETNKFRRVSLEFTQYLCIFEIYIVSRESDTNIRVFSVWKNVTK